MHPNRPRLTRPNRAPNDPRMTHETTGLLDAARALVPALAEREAATVAARRVPDATIADYHRAGILRVMQPRRFGGHQASFGVFSRVIEILAEGCAASAWVYAVLAEHQWIIACMPEQAQIDVWGEAAPAVASSSLAPRETARAVAGGWRLSGRFPFSSGCLHAAWAIIGARCEDAAGNTPTRYVLVPMREIEIVDDWDVLGLRGTGSRSLVLKDVFVPAHRSVLLRDLYDGTTPGALVHPEYTLPRAPRGLLVPFSLPGVAFTLAGRALRLVAASLLGRVSRGTHAVGASEVVQQQLGQASAEIETAALIMRARRDETVALVDAGAAVPPEAVMRNRRDIAFAVWQARRGVERLVELAGARTVYDTDPLQSLWRDIVTISTHTVVSRHLGMVPYGRMLLGLPPTAGEA
jgi:3-hydroxy-9,10-secoandrosta-1,3,5(10)-triene-9,17-dione monooxygenase